MKLRVMTGLSTPQVVDAEIQQSPRGPVLTAFCGGFWISFPPRSRSTPELVEATAAERQALKDAGFGEMLNL